MGKLEPKTEFRNVNVMLGSVSGPEANVQGMEFPCPLCGAGLPLLTSKRQKPYCTCNECGLQIFFRGKKGISRLRSMAEEGILVSSRDESSAHATVLVNRLEQLKLQKSELGRKQGIVFANPNVNKAIEIIDAEIEKVQGELSEIASSKKKKEL